MRSCVCMRVQMFWVQRKDGAATQFYISSNLDVITFIFFEVFFFSFSILIAEKAVSIIYSRNC